MYMYLPLDTCKKHWDLHALLFRSNICKFFKKVCRHYTQTNPQLKIKRKKPRFSQSHQSIKFYCYLYV